jgi:hypothetical protein
MVRRRGRFSASFWIHARPSSNEIAPEGMACVAIHAIESGQAGVEKSWWGISRTGQYLPRALAEFRGIAEELLRQKR